MSSKKIITYISALLGIYILLKICWLLSPRVFATLDLQAQDGMVRLSHSLGITQEISPDIVYVDLDDKSLFSLPYSPDSPQLYADLVLTLQKAGAAIQLIDMFFVSAKQDNSLTKAIREAGNVYLPVIFSMNLDGEDAESAMPSSAVWPLQPENLPFPAGRPTVAVNELQNAAKGLGHINCWPDHDGVYRRIPLFFQRGNGLLPTLTLKVALDYLQVPINEVGISDNEVFLPKASYPDGRTDNITIPFDHLGKTRINFIGPWPHVFAHYSVATILERGSSYDGLIELRDELEGALVLISDVTTGGRDFGPVPFSSYSPLSELHAQFLNAILTNTFAKDASKKLSLLHETVIMLILILIAISLRGYRLMGAALLTTVSVFIFNFLILSFSQLYFPLILPVALLVIGSTSILLMQFVSVQQEKKVMKARLAPYFAPVVMEKILASPEILSNVSKKKLTILFSDIVAFTAWSSDNEAQDIHETLNRYFREMSAVIFSFEGTIDKFMGDGMLAFFGDPTPQEDHAQRAVMAALAMQQKAWELKKEWTMTGGMKIRIRIGIHSGEVVVGNMGSVERMDYTVIGSHVNLAQRLESNCAPDRILISKEVHDQLDSSFITKTDGTIQVKGFKSPIEVYYVERIQPRQHQTI